MIMSLNAFGRPAAHDDGEQKLTHHVNPRLVRVVFRVRNKCREFFQSVMNDKCRERVGYGF